MGCLAGLAKIIIGIFAIILAIIGVVFMAVGGLVAVEFRSYVDGDLFKNVYLWGPVAVAIVLGIFLLLMGVFGVIGVCCEKKGLIKAFAVMMILLIILEIVVVILAFVYRGQLEDELQTGIVEGISKAYSVNGTSTKTRDALDKLQDVLNCCGGNGTQDYISQGIPIPDSCCVTVATNCTTVPSPVLNTKGCTNELTDVYKRYTNVFIGVSISFAVLELLAVIYSCYAANQDDSKLV